VTEDLTALYKKYFDVHCDIGSEQSLLAEALKLRYQVYCVECPYEDMSAFPDGMERDQYDVRALHSLLVHRASQQVAGTVRLIFPDRRAPMGSLPIDTLCTDARLRDQTLLPRHGLAEVSRFAISKLFRRRLEDVPTPTGVGPLWSEYRQAEQRRVPHLSLGLAQAMVFNSRRHGITHWVAEMEPALLRMYAKLGLHWNKVGPLVDFHGRRQPCYACIEEMLQRAQQERPDIWRLVTDAGGCADSLGWEVPKKVPYERRPPQVEEHGHAQQDRD